MSGDLLRPNDAVLPTVQDVLDLDVVRAGRPEVVAGFDALHAVVPWVHVADSLSVIGRLDGGELLLSTGASWPDSDEELAALLGDLIAARISGLVLELGISIPKVPPLAIDLFSRAGVPLVVLHEPIAFVRVTAAVHRRIIDEQTNALRARDEVHGIFTELSLRGSPVDYIVDELSRRLACDVILESPDHRMILFSGVDDSVLRGWGQLSARIQDEVTDHGRPTRSVGENDLGWLVTPVEARGRRWGTLLCAPGPHHPAGRATVAEQAAIALALNRLTGDGDDQWIVRAQRLLLDALVDGRFADSENMTARLEASGFPVAGRALVGVVVAHEQAGVVEAAARLLEAHLAESGIQCLRISGYAGTQALSRFALSLPASLQATTAWSRQLALAIAPAFAESVSSAVLVVGRESTAVAGLLESLQQASTGVRSEASFSVDRVRVVRPHERPFERVLLQLQSDPQLAGYVTEYLQPLVVHDRTNGGDLLDVLWAYVSHPGNRSKAATASRLSRSVFYQRITLIEDLLGVYLDDGAVISGLHAALTVHRAKSEAGAS